MGRRLEYLLFILIVSMATPLIVKSSVPNLITTDFRIINSVLTRVSQNYNFTTDLAITGAALKTVPDGIFDGLDYLENMTFFKCPNLQTLPVDVFQDVPNVFHLHISRSGLTSLLLGIFDGLSHVTNLVITHNQMTTLPTGIFMDMGSVKKLVLSYGKWTSFSVGAFDGLKQVQLLYLNNNPSLSSLPAGVFRDLSYLSRLFLSHTPSLRSLPEGIFRNQSRLGDLYIEFSGLRRFPDNIFKDLPSLHSIWSYDAINFGGSEDVMCQLAEFGLRRRLGIHGISQSAIFLKQLKESNCGQIESDHRMSIYCYRDIDTGLIGMLCSCQPGYQFNGTLCIQQEQCNLQNYCNHYPVCSGEQQTLRNCSCPLRGERFKNKTCHDIDECMNNTHDCDDNIACNNTVGSYKCVCKSGYGGTGMKKTGGCKDIDECMNNTHDCDDNASCNNTVGSFKCVCKSGYGGTGIKKTGGCKVADPCVVGIHDCLPTSKCMQDANHTKNHSCTCPDNQPQTEDKTCDVKPTVKVPIESVAFETSQLGSHVTLTCHIDGLVRSLMWTDKYNNNLRNNINGFIISKTITATSSSSNLTFNLKHSRLGSYTCTGFNSRGNASHIFKPSIPDASTSASSLSKTNIVIIALACSLTVVVLAVASVHQKRQGNNPLKMKMKNPLRNLGIDRSHRSDKHSTQSVKHLLHGGKNRDSATTVFEVSSSAPLYDKSSSCADQSDAMFRVASPLPIYNNPFDVWNKSDSANALPVEASSELLYHNPLTCLNKSDSPSATSVVASPLPIYDNSCADTNKSGSGNTFPAGASSELRCEKPSACAGKSDPANSMSVEASQLPTYDNFPADTNKSASANVLPVEEPSELLYDKLSACADKSDSANTTSVVASPSSIYDSSYAGLNKSDSANALPLEAYPGPIYDNPLASQ